MPARPQSERVLLNHEWRLDQLSDAVKRLQQQLRSSGGGPSGGVPAGMFVGKATSAISARSGATPGSGTVEIYDATSGTLTATGAAHTAKNAGAAISSGKYVMGWTDKFGVKWVDPEECE